MISMNIALIYVATIVSLAVASTPRTDVTVSGISSGGAMAVQLHMAYSEDISGCGILAGPPYYCAGNMAAASTCMGGTLTSKVTAAGILLKLKGYESSGSVGELSNIKGDPVYIFSGKYDIVALPSTVKINEAVYDALGANVKTNFDMEATHGFPTDNFGKSCATLNLQNYINNCDFNMAYDILNHLYGENLVKPKSGAEVPLHGQFAVFNQREFMNPSSSLTGEKATPSVLQWLSKSMSLYASKNWNWTSSGILDWTMPSVKTVRTGQATTRALAYSFDSEGYIYFPSACAQGKSCPIHVALHGCQQGKYYVDDIFATKAGYLEVAELNDIIVVFPQVAPSYLIPYNPMGCWDWWGYSTLLSFATKSAPQISGIKKMIDTVRLVGKTIVASA